MNKCWIIILFLSSLIGRAQTITTIAGTFGGPVYDPAYLAFDLQGNLYIPEMLGEKVLKIDTAGTITTIAGTGTAGFSGDSGLATSSELSYPSGVTTDTFGN